ncbi:MAG: glycoside hydrolase family 3 C-terminal domain-containing protein [Lachnospiraceae bacterium]|nr:glycoside hydrolase family 3 C-terminal domain-containing protein [Lachnospiraceae bacterium]
MNKHELRNNARQEARKKAEAIVAQMTLEEKMSQLRYDAQPIERLDIPAYNWWNEGLHGVARAGVATVFPQAIGMAATFDEELLKEMGDCVATEGRAKYNENIKHGDHDIYKGLTFWSPNVNIFRDPRWGRGHETLGEDPYLTSRLGLSFVEGLQGEEGELKAAACAKHFAVHSGPEGIRHEFDAKATAKDMEETYLPAFETLVKEGDVESVMGAYNRTNGEPCCGSKALLKDTLRDKWGFKGHVVSDCWAIADFHTKHMVTSTPQESAALAMKYGCDLNCGNTYLHMMNAYEEGLVTEEQITEAAVRLFTTRYLLGMPDGSKYDSVSYDMVECPKHLDSARRGAEESIVLLDNHKKALPLNINKIKTIGVIGPNANSIKALIGNYHGTSSQYITVLDGIRAYVGDKVRVMYSEGCDLYKDRTENLGLPYDRIGEAMTVAEHSDVVILCLGLDETLEGEEGDTGNSYASGDKNDLLLPLSQRKLCEALAGCDTPVIVCNMTGSAMDLKFMADNFDAILQLWYPGARGGQTVAKILFGDISPSGKLPVTFYDSSYDMPEFTDYGMKKRTYKYIEGEAQYPFGFGLTYSDVCVDSASVVSSNVVSVSAEDDRYDPAYNAGLATDGQVFEAVIEAVVVNKGSVDTDEVVQVYVENVGVSDAPLHPILAGFKRVHLKAGEKVSVKIPLKDPSFTVVTEGGDRVHGSHTFSLHIGTSQPDKKSTLLTGHTPIILDLQF